MSKHTPGPWKVGQYLGSPSSYCVHMDAGDKGRGIDVVEAVAGTSAEERLANARLIAAAPDLLLALLQMIDGYKIPSVRNQARAAIAKAIGETK